MNYLVFSKIGVIIPPHGKGDVSAMAVPAGDKVSTYRDLEGKSDGEIAERYGTAGKKIMWRLSRGMVTVFGNVPDEVHQLRQAVKVYLPEDFAGSDDTAFFYVLSPQWLVHGNRTTDDEGQASWRTTMLRVREGQTPVAMVMSAVSGLMLAGGQKVLVAVDEPAVGRTIVDELKTALATIDNVPVPFSALRGNLKAKPLYRHGDFSVLLYALVMVAVLTLGGMVTLWLLNKLEISRMNGEMDAVRNRIQAIQINKSLGHIRDPQPILDTMATPTNQQPSAILDAATQVSAQFGKIQRAEVELAASTLNSNAPAPIPGQQPTDMEVRVLLDQAVDTLLIEQENRAKSLLEARPWIRLIENIGTASQPRLRFVVQIVQPDGTVPTPLPEPVAAPNPVQQAAKEKAKAEAALVSATLAVSGTVVSPTVDVSPVAAPAVEHAQPVPPAGGQ